MPGPKQSLSADVESESALFAHLEPPSSRKLVLSALRAFADHGFHAATTREIAEGAGLSPRAVYIHYKSKSDLLYEITNIGHRAVLSEVEEALQAAGEDPVARVKAFISTNTTWHAAHHTLGRVIEYELRSLPRRQFRQIAGLRDRFENLLREQLQLGMRRGSFDIKDLDGTLLAALSLCIDLVRWYAPSPERSPAAIGTLHAELAIRMIRRP